MHDKWLIYPTGPFRNLESQNHHAIKFQRGTKNELTRWVPVPHYPVSRAGSTGRCNTT